MGFSGRKGVTLVELIMASMLLGVVILAGISMELGMRRLYYSSDAEVTALGEASPFMVMVFKTVSLGIGDAFNPAYSNGTLGGYAYYDIRIDSNQNGRADANDTWVRYAFRNGTKSAYYCRNNTIAFSSCDRLSNRTTEFVIWPPSPGTGTSRVRITVLKDPNNLTSGYGNPNVTIDTLVYYRSLSLT